tara:strand:- start:13444 stop:13758 length:315 start_codon:yes stop_codon:yes gene_type:complete
MKITKRQLRRIIKEEKARLVNEIQAEKDVRQLTLNQGEVDKVEAMRSALDRMFFEYRKINSIPPQWLDDSNGFGTSRYDKLEELLMDAGEEMSDLVHDMKKVGI